MKLSQRLLEVARDLNDAEPGHEFATWPREQLLAWFNEARCNAFSLNPTKFATTKVIKLDPGTDQEPCDCSILHKILGQTDASGLVTTPIGRSNEVVLANWGKLRQCQPSSSSVVLSEYTFDPLENGRFSVRPPVPPNADVYVKVVCYEQPAALTTADDVDLDDCSTLTAAHQWVLYRALMVDDESASSVSAATTHANMFFQLLQVQYTQALAHQLGMVGSAPRVGGRK